MRSFLKIISWLCKIAAIVFWLVVAWVTISLDISSLNAPSHWREGDDWGTPEFHHRIYLEIAEVTTLAVLALLPNRWLVFSPATFVISLLIALTPFCSISGALTEWPDLLWLMPVMLLLSLLPLSLILSFWRQRKGKKIGYA
jgi:uncharacterized membrane protein YtjA (UPF0391 family)